MKAKFNLWLEQGGTVVLSAWRIRLLEAIAETGSISAAAEKLKVPYRRAWEKLQEMETGLGRKLVDTAVCGAGGGGASLTEEGQRAVERFRAFADGFEDLVAKRYAEVYGKDEGRDPSGMKNEFPLR